MRLYKLHNSRHTAQMAARALGLPDDVAEFQADIDTWHNALNQYAWDGEAGYFGYVCHSPAPDDGKASFRALHIV